MKNAKIKILLLHPGNLPKNPNDIKCFSDVWTYYLTKELGRHCDLKIRQIPKLSDSELVKWFDGLDPHGYDAAIALGLRYFSTVPQEIGQTLRRKIFPGFLCQVHDGSRLDNDPVDITFTLKKEDDKYYFGSEANRYVRHNAFNEYVGWAADPVLNCPAQNPEELRILVDHTNYGDNPIDQTVEILHDIKKFVDSRMWESQYKSVSVRRFDSGRVVDVDLDNLSDIERYDRTGIPLPEICKEHSAAHIFCVTHPESVGLVVLETAMAGALTITPEGFIPKDRLSTVRAIEFQDSIDWANVLTQIDPELSRQVALNNTWENVAKRMLAVISIRARIRKLND